MWYAQGTAGDGCCKQPKLGRVDLLSCVQLRLERFNLQPRRGISGAQGFVLGMLAEQFGNSLPRIADKRHTARPLVCCQHLRKSQRFWLLFVHGRPPETSTGRVQFLPHDSCQVVVACAAIPSHRVK